MIFCGSQSSPQVDLQEMSLVALVRPASPALQHGERSHIGREPIDFALAQQQHARYVQALTDAGARIVEVPVAPELPDSVFIEDTALVMELVQGEDLHLLPRPSVPVGAVTVPLGKHVLANGVRRVSDRDSPHDERSRFKAQCEREHRDDSFQPVQLHVPLKSSAVC